jgi:hypothetical protein
MWLPSVVPEHLSRFYKNSIVKMKAKMVTSYQTTRRHITENPDLSPYITSAFGNIILTSIK